MDARFRKGAALLLIAAGLFAAGLLTTGCRRTPAAEEREPNAVVSQKASGAAQGKVAEPAPEVLELDVDATQQWGGLKATVVGRPQAAKYLVVLFHGYGARGDDLLPLAEELHQALEQRAETAFVLPAAPFVRAAGGRAWFRRDGSNFEEGLSWAQKSVDAVLRLNDKARLAIGGFSQGAMITVNLLRDSKENLVGAMMLSPASLIVREPGDSSHRPPLFISHGTRDRILPYRGAVELRDKLKKDGFPVTWVEFNGPHAIPEQVRQGMSSFLEARLKDAQDAGK